jgi:hypothetical protein
MNKMDDVRSSGKGNRVKLDIIKVLEGPLSFFEISISNFRGQTIARSFIGYIPKFIIDRAIRQSGTDSDGPRNTITAESGEPCRRTPTVIPIETHV